MVAFHTIRHVIFCRLKAERSAARIDRAAQQEMQRVEAIKKLRRQADDRRAERSERELGLKFSFSEALRHNVSILKVRQYTRAPHTFELAKTCAASDFKIDRFELSLQLPLDIAAGYCRILTIRTSRTAMFQREWRSCKQLGHTVWPNTMGLTSGPKRIGGRTGSLPSKKRAALVALRLT